MDESKDILIAALEESVDLLTEENSRYRRSNSLLRRINSDLRQKLNTAHENDEAFKSMCQGEVPIPEFTVNVPGYYKVEIETDISGLDGGLPEGTF